jgi:threonine synthase
MITSFQIGSFMKYKSTRGGVHGLSFEDALYTGYASDGGILIPESIPVISKETLKSWVPLSYKELAKKIVPLFVTEDEIPMSKLDGKYI